MNERDSEAVAAMLRARGYRIVADEDDCDILLLNTCSVRDAAEQKAIGKAGYLQQRKKTRPEFVLGILGCMAQNRGASLLDQLPDVDLIVGTQKFHQVPGYLAASPWFQGRSRRGVRALAEALRLRSPADAVREQPASAGNEPAVHA